MLIGQIQRLHVRLLNRLVQLRYRFFIAKPSVDIKTEKDGSGCIFKDFEKCLSIYVLPNAVRWYWSWFGISEDDDTWSSV